MAPATENTDCETLSRFLSPVYVILVILGDPAAKLPSKITIF